MALEAIREVAAAEARAKECKEAAAMQARQQIQEAQKQARHMVEEARRQAVGFLLPSGQFGGDDLYAAHVLQQPQQLRSDLCHGDETQMFHFYNGHQRFTTFSMINWAAWSSRWRAASF